MTAAFEVTESTFYWKKLQHLHDYPDLLSFKAVPLSVSETVIHKWDAAATIKMKSLKIIIPVFWILIGILWKIISHNIDFTTNRLQKTGENTQDVASSSFSHVMICANKYDIASTECA